MPLELHQFVIQWDLPNPSPFCLKVETFLKLAGVDYEVKDWSPMTAPLGKAPFVVLDGDVIPDSTRILRELTERLELDLDSGFSPEALARGRALNRVLEDHTYWAILVLRWLQDEPWATYRNVIGSGIPALIRTPMTAWLRRGVRQSAHAHGLGRHPVAEVVRRARADLETVAALIEGPFALGERPSSVDAGVYAFLEVLAHPLGTESLADLLAPRTLLRAYVDRMRTEAWPDWSFPPL